MTARGAFVSAVLITAVTFADVSAAPGADAAVEMRIKRLDRRLRMDRSFKIRLLAARKLGELAEGPARAHPKAIQSLVFALSDRNRLVRAMAARGLGRHGDRRADAALQRLVRLDPEPSVRRAARAALRSTAPTPSTRPPHRPVRIALGTVQFEAAHGLGAKQASALQARLSHAVEDRLQPHRPAIFPRESPDLRMDVRIRRTAGAISKHNREIAYEVRVLLVEVPRAHLRHTSKAVAQAESRRVRASRLEAFEEQVALEAVGRAVQEALATAVDPP